MKQATNKHLIQLISELWLQINHDHLAGQLRMPVFALTGQRTRLGAWRSDTREMSFSFHALLHLSHREIGEILRHEMAHQYVSEVLEIREKPHGPAFSNACHKLGILDRAHFKTKPSRWSSTIEKCLRLSGSPNIHEAETALRKAKQLMEKFGLPADGEASLFVYEYLGSPRKIKATRESSLINLLVTHFHIRALWIPDTTLDQRHRLWLVEICGLPHHVQTAIYVYHFLQREIDRLWRQYRLNHNVKGKSAKRSFFIGACRGLSESLEPDAKQQGLVTCDHHAVLEFQKKRHGQLNRSKRSIRMVNHAFAQGQEQGRNVRIRKGLSTHDDDHKLLES